MKKCFLLSVLVHIVLFVFICFLLMKQENHSSYQRKIPIYLLVEGKTSLIAAQQEEARKQAKFSADSTAFMATLSQQIVSCVQKNFNIIALGFNKNSALQINVHFSLRLDGFIQGEPVIKVMGGDYRQHQICVRQVRTALNACLPFSFPKDKYSLWRDVDMIFDPYGVLEADPW